MRNPSSSVWSMGFRLLVGALAVVSLAHVGILFPRFFAISDLVPRGYQVVVWAILVTILTAVGACILALLLTARSWSRAGARSLALFLALLGVVWGSLLRFLQVQVTSEELTVNLSVGGLPLTLVVMGVFLSTAAFLRFSASFPISLTAADLPAPHRWSVLRRLRALTLNPRVVWGTAVALILLHKSFGPIARILGFGGQEPGSPGSGPPGFFLPLLLVNLAYLGLLPLATIAFGIWNLGSGYRLAPRDQRRRVLWLVSGASAAGWLILGGILIFVTIVLLDIQAPGWVPFTLAGMVVAGPAVLVIMTAVALFYSGAVDPGLVLKRSTVMGALGLAGILLFAGLEEALSEWVESRANLPGFIGSVLAGAVAAGVMLPLRKGLSRVANRVLPGQDGQPAVPPEKEEASL